MGECQGSGSVVVTLVVGVQDTAAQLRAQALDEVSGDHSVPGRDGEVHLELHQAQLKGVHIVCQGATMEVTTQTLLHIHTVVGWLKLPE